MIRRRVESGRLDEIPRFLDAATACAQRGGALTHRLLAFARKQPLDIRPNDVNRIIAGMEEMLHRTLGEDVELDCALAPGLWTAFVDANQLESAVLNLCINARDAMPDGGHLTIKTSNAQIPEDRADPELACGDYVVTTVSDDGSGMPEAVLAKAIDPFFTTKSVGRGTGLGLSMVYGFAKQSRGHLRIQSKVGEGTTVELYLPRAFQDAVDLDKPSGETPRGQGETILVVEDDDTVRVVLADALQELGYRVVAASDARPAIPILKSDSRIDLMTSDVVLPHIGGRKLAEVARAARPGLKILFITGYAEHATNRADFLSTGMDMLIKPFALDALGSKIRSMLDA